MILSLNETALPSPAALSVKVTPQAGTMQYNTLGQAVIDGMREKRTVEITWTRLGAEDLNTLSRELTFSAFLTCVYPDPLLGSRSMRCRAVSHFARVYQYLNGVPVWADVKLTLEEQ